MKECTEVFDAQAKTVHTNCLGLVTEKRTYYIAAETKDEITKWLEVNYIILHTIFTDDTVYYNVHVFLNKRIY